MGYYTDYEITKASEEAEECLKELSVYGWDSDCLWDAKWYDWKEHLKEASTKYPDELIILDGVGEEYPDIWRAYAKGGKVEVVKAEITFKEPYF